jgi:hypothetical protein
MKPIDTNVKSDNSSNGGNNGDCKNSKSIYEMLNLIQDAQSYVEALQNNGQKVTEEKKGNGDERN